MRRLVLYAHGFDPRGPAPYHAMQKADAGRELPRIGLTVGPRHSRDGETAWTLNTRWPDGEAAVDFVVLRWDDLVRARWDKDLWPQFRALVRWCLAYVRKGLFAEAGRSARPLFWAMIAPPATVGLYVLAVILAAFVTTALLGWIAATLGAPPWLGLMGLGVLAIGPAGWKRVDERVNICWLSRCFGYLAELGEGRTREYNARADIFAARLIKAVETGEADEILVVGHSIGTLFAASLVGRALKTQPQLGAASGRPRVTLMTVGHCISIYGRLGHDAAFADDLRRLVETPHIHWLDVTAPSDAASSCGWHPLRFSASENLAERVVRRSPRFHLSMDAEAFRRIRRDPMAFHFQYLKSSDRPEVYDWFRLIAGPVTEGADR